MTVVLERNFKIRIKFFRCYNQRNVESLYYKIVFTCEYIYIKEYSLKWMNSSVYVKKSKWEKLRLFFKVRIIVLPNSLNWENIFMQHSYFILQVDLLIFCLPILRKRKLYYSHSMHVPSNNSIFMWILKSIWILWWKLCLI